MIMLQPLGGCAVGKSLLFETLARNPFSWMERTDAQSHVFTFCPAIRLVMVGSYLGKRSRGIDGGAGQPGPRTKATALAALDVAMDKAAKISFDVAWEGQIIQTRQYHHTELLPRGLHPLYVFLDVPYPIVVERILTLRGGRLTSVQSHGADKRRLAAWLEAEGASVLRLDGTAPIGYSAKQVRATLWTMRCAT